MDLRVETGRSSGEKERLRRGPDRRAMTRALGLVELENSSARVAASRADSDAAQAARGKPDVSALTVAAYCLVTRLVRNQPTERCTPFRAAPPMKDHAHATTRNDLPRARARARVLGGAARFGPAIPAADLFHPGGPRPAARLQSASGPVHSAAAAPALQQPRNPRFAASAGPGRLLRRRGALDVDAVRRRPGRPRGARRDSSWEASAGPVLATTRTPPPTAVRRTTTSGRRSTTMPISAPTASRWARPWTSRSA